MTRTLADVIDGRSNNFDLIRLCAALFVMFGHSFWIQPAAARVEPILSFTGLEYSGSLAVYAFFLISGMLVTASYVRQKSALRFAVLRLARIYPGLFVCVLLSAYVLNPLLSTRGSVESLGSADAFNYFAKNVSLLGGTAWNLPGLFENVALKGVVNGSLWTLPLEVKCYLLVFSLGLLGLLWRRWSIIACACLALGGMYYLVTHGSPYDFFRRFANKPTGYSFYPACFFMFGMILFALRKKVPLNPIAWAIVAAIYLFLRNTAASQSLFYITVIYGILCLSASSLLYRLQPKYDCSYGIYLWAFPIQQIVASIWPDGDNLIGLLVSIPITIGIGVLSWRLVELPAMLLARRILDQRATRLIDKECASMPSIADKYRN